MSIVNEHRIHLRRRVHHLARNEIALFSVITATPLLREEPEAIKFLPLLIQGTTTAGSTQMCGDVGSRGQGRPIEESEWFASFPNGDYYKEQNIWLTSLGDGIIQLTGSQVCHTHTVLHKAF